MRATPSYRGPTTGPDYEIRVVGAEPPGLRDLYHALLNMPWRWLIVLISAVYLLVNAIFAVLFLAAGGLANARPGSFADAFFFSVQTMGTIGYGAMYPVGTTANVLVVAESVVGLLLTALATGLVFVRFSLVRPRVRFSRAIGYAPMDGVPTLSVRVGNQRGNLINDATLRMSMTRTVRTAEGSTFYRTVDLPLVRGHALTLARSWNLLHRVDAASPLLGETPESLEASEVEIVVALSGVDDTTLQPVHARHTYGHRAVMWGERLDDVLSEQPDGNLLLDLRRFHDTVPVPASETFPYPRQIEVGQGAE